MKILRYFILALFIFSVFSFVLALTKNDTDYNSLYQDVEWLMLKSEKKDFEKAKTDLERKQIMERFWQARDTDSSTFINEFKKFYMERLEVARKDYQDSSDPRRYIFLLFGQPSSRRTFMNERITIFGSSPITISIGSGEIWEYRTKKEVFQVIFGTIDLRSLESARSRYLRGQEPNFTANLTQGKCEILYLGIKKYSSIAEFLQDFFYGAFGIRSTDDVIDDQKSPILNRAKEFYKDQEPKVREKNRKGKYSNGSLSVNVLIDPFGFWFGESRINVWCILDKDSLVRKKDAEYKADISLFWELRNENNQRVVYYQKDFVEYKLSERRNYCYNFWGSAPPGKYKLILEIGENLGKHYKKIEVDIPVWTRANSKLEAEIIAGKVFREKQDWLQGKDFNPFSIEGSQFLPLSVLKFHYFRNEYYFTEEDEVAVFFNVSGFLRDIFGNPCLDRAVVFTNNQGEKFAYRFRTIKKMEREIAESSMSIKVSDLIKRFKVGYGYYNVILSISDVIAGRKGEGEVVYSEGKEPYQILIVKPATNN